MLSIAQRDGTTAKMCVAGNNAKPQDEKKGSGELIRCLHCVAPLNRYGMAIVAQGFYFLRNF
jgi:hypothetical protein